MKKFPINRLGILLLLLNFVFPSLGQDLPTSINFKIRSKYRNGEYERSLELSDHVINQFKKGKIANKFILAEAQLYKIKNTLITKGDIEAVLTLESEYLENLLSIDSEKMSFYALGMSNIASIYSDFGYQNIGFQRLEKAKSIATKYQQLELLEEIKLTEIKTLNNCGYFDEAYKLALSLEIYAKTKIQTSYDFTNLAANSALKGKYTSKQLFELKRKYADFLNYKAIIKHNEGDYIVSDSLAKIAYEWITENIDKKARDVSAFDNRMIVIYNYEKLDQDQYAHLFTYNNMVSIKPGLKPSLNKSFAGYTYLPESKSYLDYEEYLSRHYWKISGLKIGMKAQADGYYAKHHSFYERSGQNRDNVNILKAEMMLIDKHLIAEDYYTAKKLTDSLIIKKHHNSNALFLNDKHPYKRELILKALFINTKLGLRSEVEDRISELIKVDKELLLENSPNHINDILLIASYQHQMLGDFNKPLQVFNNLYINNFENRLHALHPEQRNFINEYADLLLNAGQLDKAHSLVDKEINALSPYQHQNKNVFALELLKKANLLLASGKYNEASKLLLDSKSDGPIYSIVTNSNFKIKSTTDEYFRMLTHKNMIYGDLSEAKKSMNSISNLQEHDFIEFAQVFVSTGKTEYISYKLEKLEEKYLENYGPESPKMLNLLNNIARIEAQKGEFGKASKKSLQSLSIAEKTFTKNSFQYADAAFVNGEVALNFGDYSNAVREFKKSTDAYLHVYGERNINYARSLSETSLARLYKNDLNPEIEDAFSKASNIVKNTIGFTSFENATILKNQAFYYLATDQIAFAERDIQQSIHILTDLGEKEYKQILAENYRIYAKILQYNKEYRKSEDSYKKALSYYYDLFDDKTHLDITLTKSNLAQLYYIQGERKDSKEELNKTTEIYLSYIEKYFSYLTEREKKEFWKKISQDFEFFKTIAFENNNKREIETVYNNALSTKGILLNSTKQLRDAIELSDNSHLKATFNEWSAKSETLTRSISMSNEQLKEENIDLENLQKEIDKLEKSLSANSTDFASQNTTSVTTWKDVKDALKTNEYAVEIIRYNKFDKDFTDVVVYKALIIGKDYSTPKVIEFTDGKKLDGKFLNYYRNTTKFKKTDLISYKIFYEPIHKEVGDGATVYISLEGVFNLINLEAMLIKDSTYVMDKNQIIIVPSTKEIINKQNNFVKTGHKNALIISNPMYYANNISKEDHGNAKPDAPWKQLPGAEKEGKIIDSMFTKDHWNSTLVKWDKADENIIKNIGKNEYKNISYLHIATHGFFEEAAPISLASSLDSRRGLDDPYLRAGLLFKNAGDVMNGNDVLNYNIADGVLTAKEISTLNLKGVDIVVLSACETGLGDIASGEGVYGLQRAFLSAGVKMVVISLFKVDDIVTTKFMEKMGSKFLETNNPRVAMEYAKKEIQKEYKDPIYWGSFLLVD